MFFKYFRYPNFLEFFRFFLPKTWPKYTLSGSSNHFFKCFKHQTCLNNPEITSKTSSEGLKDPKKVRFWPKWAQNRRNIEIFKKIECVTFQHPKNNCIFIFSPNSRENEGLQVLKSDSANSWHYEEAYVQWHWHFWPPWFLAQPRFAKLTHMRST